MKLHHLVLQSENAISAWDFGNYQSKQLAEGIAAALNGSGFFGNHIVVVKELKDAVDAQITPVKRNRSPNKSKTALGSKLATAVSGLNDAKVN